MDLPTGTVTFLLTDIESSTRLWEERPEAMRAALARHDALAQRVIQQHEGALIKERGEGDSLFAVFARATDALAAACALQQALRAEPWPAGTPLRARMALHTGETERRAGDYFGPAVNRCARLRSIAHGGQTLLSGATEQQVRGALPDGASLRDRGQRRLKDLLQPERVFELIHPALPDDFPPLLSLDALPTNLPAQLTSFIGREKEMEEVQRLLASTRLLTLTGTGGVGKTRLALQAAAEALEQTPDGVWLVELAPLADPTLIPQVVAQALGVREEPGRPVLDTLTDHLRSLSLLLVLDNCEHLIEECARLADTLLRAGPRLKILATSREPLGLAGERAYRVPSLLLPGPDCPPVAEEERRDALLDCEAVRLFVERAQERRFDFHLTGQNADAVAQVCRRLDGIPLALELAAARVRAMSVEQIAARLDDRFRLLTGGSRDVLPRQQTLRAAMDWSYDLLSEAERKLLARLSVFSGGWTLEAAESVCAGEGIEEWEALDRLTGLVDKSLVLFEEPQSGDGRYRLLETVRQYGAEKLEQEEASERWRTRHLDWFRALAEQAEKHLKGPDQAAWLERLETEHDNLRDALRFSIEPRDEEREPASDLPAPLDTRSSTPIQTGLCLAGALRTFWIVRGYAGEARRHSARLLAHPQAQARGGPRARVLLLAGKAAHSQGDFEAARPLLQESLAIWRECGDPGGAAQALFMLGQVEFGQANYEPARDYCEQSLAHYREGANPAGISLALSLLGHICFEQGRLDAARARYEESLALDRQSDQLEGVGVTLGNLGLVAAEQGDWPAARAYQEESLAIKRALGHKYGIAWTLEQLGHLVANEGDLAGARALQEEGLALRRELGDKHDIANSFGSLGDLAVGQGDLAEARRCYDECLRLHHEIGNKHGTAVGLERLARLAHARKQWRRAAGLFGAMDALREGIGAPLLPLRRVEVDECLVDTRAALGELAFEASWQEGRAMAMEQAVACALEPEDHG